MSANVPLAVYATLGAVLVSAAGAHPHSPTDATTIPKLERIERVCHRRRAGTPQIL